MSSNPHDALFKALIAQPEHARGALRAAIPPGIAESLDWPTLARCPGNFIDRKLHERHADALFSLTWRGGSDAPVYVLFEHQSTPDSQMAFRLLCYAVGIWERWQREHPRADTLPMVVPVVLCHGAAPWPAPMTLDALLDLPDAVRSAAPDQLPWLTYLLDDLSQVSDHELRNLREMTATSRLVYACFKYTRTCANLLEILSGWDRVIRDVGDAPNGLDALGLIANYILIVSNHVEREELLAFLGRILGPVAKDIVMTAGERLIQQGIEQGIEQGIQQGIQRGERGVLLRQLRARFGNQVDASIERRVEAASDEQIGIWLVRVLSAATLAEIMAS